MSSICNIIKNYIKNNLKEYITCIYFIEYNQNTQENNIHIINKKNN